MPGETEDEGTHVGFLTDDGAADGRAQRPVVEFIRVIELRRHAWYIWYLVRLYRYWYG